jgi:cyanate permease
MNVWAALAGGFVGTLVLTTVMRTASEIHLTRMDLPFLLGTLFTADRARAKALGYLAHAAMGLAFALGYYGLFLALGHHDWWIGTLLGLGHGLFASTALVNVLLPAIHPRMGSDLSDAGSVALLEPPGFLLRNYGAQTPVVSLLAHLAYGTIVAVFLTAAG